MECASARRLSRGARWISLMSARWKSRISERSENLLARFLASRRLMTQRIGITRGNGSSYEQTIGFEGWPMRQKNRVRSERGVPIRWCGSGELFHQVASAAAQGRFGRRDVSPKLSEILSSQK